MRHAPPNLGSDPAPEAAPCDTKRGRPAPSPFVAAQPPPITPGDTPFNMIRLAKLQTWPKMVDPKGKHQNQRSDTVTRVWHKTQENPKTTACQAWSSTDSSGPR
jgi:hypothetical protein